jgi:iron complex transport system ATP-binding protein
MFIRNDDQVGAQHAVPLLAFQDIAFRYQPHNGPVLAQLALEIRPGTITAILGPNGIGKTTLLHLALGWLKPESGRIVLAGQPLGSYSRHELGQWMGLVPQSEHMPFDYPILEYVLLGRAPYLKPLEMPGERDCRIARQALDQVGLGGLAGRAVTRLSGGERQLVLVARALAQQPKLLLLDEPTSHLDLSNKSRLLGLLEKLATQGVTILLTTHEPEVAAAIATHLVLMERGHKYHGGPLEQVLTTERLTATYGMPVEVIKVAGRRVVLWNASH